jgi:RES domain-containing protein
MNRDLANAIAGTTPANAFGTYHRHAWAGATGLKGSTSGGRWSPEDTYPTIYLGEPEPSVIVEAHRRLVDGVEGMRPELVAPRKFITVEVDVSNLLDLRTAAHREAVGLDFEALAGPWAPCQRVGRAAHQLGMHGIITPAATSIGITLALFEHHLPPNEWPHVIAEVIWDHLPADPRRLRAVEENA